MNEILKSKKEEIEKTKEELENLKKTEGPKLDRIEKEMKELMDKINNKKRGATEEEIKTKEGDPSYIMTQDEVSEAKKEANKESLSSREDIKNDETIPEKEKDETAEKSNKNNPTKIKKPSDLKEIMNHDKGSKVEGKLGVKYSKKDGVEVRAELKINKDEKKDELKTEKETENKEVEQEVKEGKTLEETRTDYIKEYKKCKNEMKRQLSIEKTSAAVFNILAGAKNIFSKKKMEKKVFKEEDFFTEKFKDIKKEYTQARIEMGNEMYAEKKAELEKTGLSGKELELALTQYKATEIIGKTIIDERQKLIDMKAEGAPVKIATWKKLVDGYLKMPKWQRVALSTIVFLPIAATGALGASAIAAGGIYAGIAGLAGVKFATSMAIGAGVAHLNKGVDWAKKGSDSKFEKTEDDKKTSLKEKFAQGEIGLEEYENEMGVIEREEKKHARDRMLLKAGVGIALAGLAGAGAYHFIGEAATNLGGGHNATEAVAGHVGLNPNQNHMDPLSPTSKTPIGNIYEPVKAPAGNIDPLSPVSKTPIGNIYEPQRVSAGNINPLDPTPKTPIWNMYEPVKAPAGVENIAVPKVENINVAMVIKGGSYERSFIHQIEADHKLAQDLGYKGDLNDVKALHHFAGHEAHLIAMKTGIVNTDGQQIGIKGEIAPVIKIENGHTIIENTTSDGKIIEIHHEGDKFGESLNKHEYIIKNHDNVKISSNEYAVPKQVDPTTGESIKIPNTVPEQVDPITGEHVSINPEQSNPIVEPSHVSVSQSSPEVKPENFKFDNPDHVIKITENNSNVGMKFIYNADHKIIGTDVTGNYNAETDVYTNQIKLHELDGFRQVDASSDILEMKNEALFLDKLPHNTIEYKYLHEHVIGMQKDIIKNYGDVINSNKLETNSETIIPPLHELTGEQLIKIGEVSRENINHLFPEKIELWNNVAKNVSADRILTELGGNGVSPEYQPLISYMEKLQEVSGIKPITQNLLHEAETIPHYINRALEKIEEMGQLNKVKL